MPSICLLRYLLLCFIVLATVSTTIVELHTRQGVIYGRRTEQSIEYLGIQYAKVIRWKPPIDLGSETFPNGSYQAISFGPCCPQPHTVVYIPKQDEQCLYLNIYQPIVSSNHSLLPVFVWIHGGAHSVGCTSQSIPLLFNGTNMITYSPSDQPVIIVTIEYRLGVLADMYLEELVAEDPEWPTAGNYMYLDMLSALRWIKKNIRDYQGDPDRISIFGESAGGLSVVDLGAVRGSAGLYRAAISQSGLGSPGTYSSYYNKSNALDYSKSLVQQLNCTSDDRTKVLSCMRNTSIDDLFKIYTNRYTRPIIDDYFFPLYPPLAIQNGSYNNITLIMGNNDYEQPICVQHPDMNFNDAIILLRQSIEEKWLPFIVDNYHLNSCLSDRTGNISRCCNIVRLILMDKIFDCDIRRIFNAFYSKYDHEYESNKLFTYHLNCYPQCPAYPDEGVCQHGSEQAYVFGTESNWFSVAPLNCTWNNQTRTFSNHLIAHWINIATTERPLSSWPSYNLSTPKYFHITPDQGFLPEIWSRNCSLFDQMEEEGIRRIFQKNI